jgi:hypothetical protein
MGNLLLLTCFTSPSFQHHGIGGRRPEDGTHPRGTGEGSNGPASPPPGVRATPAGAAEERSRRQSPTTVTRGGRARCLQHGASAGRVGGPRFADGGLSAPEDEQLHSHPEGQDGAAAADPSPTRGATPTSSRSSGLFDSADNDMCQRAAGFDDKPRGEPLELAAPGGGRSSTSTLLPGYPGPLINVVGQNKCG